MSMVVKDSFTNNNGICYDKVRETAFSDFLSIGKIGTFAAESNTSNVFSYGDTSEPSTGVYIYQSNADPNIGYRIYKEFNDYGFNGYFDDKLIQGLQERQPGIKKTSFPLGVVTVNNKIIGQEIVYFPLDITVYKLFKISNVKDPVLIYRKILDAIKEMSDNGVSYLDIHPRNFMLRPFCKDINIDVIDFDSKYVKIDDSSIYTKQQLFDNYSSMINVLNKIKGIDPVVGKFKANPSFDDAYEQLDAMTRKLSK